jgi:hypothetical protein
MKPRPESKPAVTPPKPPEQKAPPRLRIVALEPRIAPKIATNHNETLVRDEQPKPAATPPKPAESKAPPRLRIVPLEPRIAPKLAVNHNETLVRDRTR